MTSPRTTNPKISRKNNPKNEGRSFQAWCGGQYIFYRGPEGKLHTRPDGFAQFMRDWRTGGNKKDYFRKLYYSGIEDHSWYSERLGNWTPPEEGESRITVKQPPLYW